MSAYGVSFSLLFLLILANVISPNEASTISQVSVFFFSSICMFHFFPPKTQLIDLLLFLYVYNFWVCIECLFLDLEANGSLSLESKSEEMVPLMEIKTVMMMNETRRKLNSFQICAVCTCCGGAKGLCLPSPCCYAINCNIPNKPFGFCSFTPQTCNCLRCHL